MRFTLPNLLSISRLVLAAAFPTTREPIVQAGLIALAGGTDFVDGWIARRFGQRSRVGELLDPVADKLFVLSVVLTFLLQDRLLLWQVLVLLSRDIYNTAAIVFIKIRRIRLRFASRLSGKIVTTLQIASLLAVVLLPHALTPLLWGTLAAALISIVDYTLAGLSSLRAARQTA